MQRTLYEYIRNFSTKTFVLNPIEDEGLGERRFGEDEVFECYEYVAALTA